MICSKYNKGQGNKPGKVVNMKTRDYNAPFESWPLEDFETFVKMHIGKPFQPGVYIARVAYQIYCNVGKTWVYDYEIFYIPGDIEDIDWSSDWMYGNLDSRVLWVLPLDDFMPDKSNRDNIIHFGQYVEVGTSSQRIIESYKYFKGVAE